MFKILPTTLLTFATLSVGCSSASTPTAATDSSPSSPSHSDPSRDESTTTEASNTKALSDSSETTASRDGGAEKVGSATAEGTLGDLGPVQPIVWTFFINNSNETIIYMSSSALTCDEIAGRDGSRWLLKTAVGSQVVEIVVSSSDAAKGSVDVGPGGAEINYAPGGKSSSYEQNAGTGSVTFTNVVPEELLEGTFEATYSNPTGQVSGSFHAVFCPGGQEY